MPEKQWVGVGKHVIYLRGHRERVQAVLDPELGGTGNGIALFGRE
jgi:hypothetical protein